MREHAERLRAAFDELVRLRSNAEAWKGDLAPHTWGPGHVLAHVAEMLPFWLGEIERVLDDARDPAPFGRVKSDPVRIGTIERDHSLPFRELYSRIECELDRACARLADISEDKRCVHPTLGEMTLDKLADEFLSGHLEEHAAQLREIVGGEV